MGEGSFASFCPPPPFTPICQGTMPSEYFCKISTIKSINQIKISVVNDILTVNREQRG